MVLEKKGSMGNTLVGGSELSKQLNTGKREKEREKQTELVTDRGESE